ncbi:MAG TPA: hypothetical protein PKE47_10925, partial [Verrucomicrobiota bacterium]|nr:hypothetical protein [Verrucomicrobiota bacterium]
IPAASLNPPGTSSLTFDIGRSFTGGYSAEWAVFSSVDSFASSVASGSLTTGASGTLAGQSVDLSAAAYQGLSAVTFRLAFADSNNGVPNSILVDNVTLNGAVVPEPHEYAALAGLGLLGFAVWRRTRRA